VLVASPETLALTETALVTTLTAVEGVVERPVWPNCESVPYSNQYVADVPFGLTVPRNVAVVTPTEAALRVVTAADTSMAGPSVLKLKMPPFTVPN
jgi:hypothetical protein